MKSRYEQFASSISAIYHAIQRIERNEMVRFGSRGVYAQYLAALHSCPEGLTAARLSELCDRDKAAVSRAVADMEAEGLIQREGREDTMYRAVIRLTEQGRQAAEYVAGRASAAVEAGGRGLRPKERDALQAALALIADNLETIMKEGVPAETAARRCKP